MVFVLLKERFDESFVLPLTYGMRQRGIPVHLVGMQAGVIRGLYGIRICPDHDLLKAPAASPEQDVQLLIIPGQKSCTAQLLLDARVHHLIEKVLANGGFVAVPSLQTQELLQRSGVNLAGYEGQFLVQNGREISDFIQQLLSNTISWVGKSNEKAAIC